MSQTAAKRIVRTEDGTQIYCVRCEVLKPEAEFAKDSSNKSGRQPYCRDCQGRMDRKRAYGREEPTRSDSAGKSCLKCDVYKPFSEYSSNRHGLLHVCKHCIGYSGTQQEGQHRHGPAARPVERAPLPASMMAMMFGSGGEAPAQDDFLAIAQMMAGAQLELFDRLLKARGHP